MVTNKVVVQLKDKSVLKGKTNNFFPNKNSFHLELINGEKTEIQIEGLKAIFFVKSFDGNNQHQNSYVDKVAGGGRKIKVKFKDGETIIGFTTGYSPDRIGFYMMPADLKGNNERIFVVKSATETIEML
jgi:small nuclear ribonucleoprotein (snRNP)-like protein